MTATNLSSQDTIAIRVLRALNCILLGWMFFTMSLTVWREPARKRKALELVAMTTMGLGFLCVFLVTIEVVFLPLRGVPLSYLECNFFERGGNVSHFSMFAGIVYFFYLRTEVIRGRIMSNSVLQSRAFSLMSRALVALVVAGFAATCAYIESFPLDDPTRCFFGVRPFVGSLVTGLLASSAFVFLVIFTYILFTETTMSAEVRRMVLVCWLTTLVAFLSEALCFLVLNNIFASELWNLVLHMDITLNMFLMVANLSNWQHRIFRNPFKRNAVLGGETTSSSVTAGSSGSWSQATVSHEMSGSSGPSRSSNIHTAGRPKPSSAPDEV